MCSGGGGKGQSQAYDNTSSTAHRMHLVNTDPLLWVACFLDQVPSAAPTRRPPYNRSQLPTGGLYTADRCLFWGRGVDAAAAVRCKVTAGSSRATGELRSSLSNATSGAIGDPLVRASMLQLNDADSMPAVNHLCHLPWSGQPDGKMVCSCTKPATRRQMPTPGERLNPPPELCIRGGRRLGGCLNLGWVGASKPLPPSYKRCLLPMPTLRALLLRPANRQPTSVGGCRSTPRSNPARACPRGVFLNRSIQHTTVYLGHTTGDTTRTIGGLLSTDCLSCNSRSAMFALVRYPSSYRVTTVNCANVKRHFFSSATSREILNIVGSGHSSVLCQDCCTSAFVEEL